MGNPYLFWLSAIIFLPVLGAVALLFVPKGKDDLMRYVTLVVTAAVLLLCVVLFLTPALGGKFDYQSERASLDYQRGIVR